MSTLQQIINEAYHAPKDAVYFDLNQRLKAAFPDRYLFETEDNSFDLERFYASGFCTITSLDGGPAEWDHSWSYYDQKIYRTLRIGCLRVQWGEEFFDWIQVGLIGKYGIEERNYLLGASQAAVEGLFEAVCRWAMNIDGQILVFSDGCWSRSVELFESIKGTVYDDLVLPEALKVQLRSGVHQFFESKEMYKQYGLPWKRGLLLLGSPGNGKTHAIKGLANELSVPCLYVRSFKSSYGTDHRNIAMAFSKARELAPCLMVLEDLDSLVNDRNRSFFLNEMDGFYANEGILIIASTNHPERLDPAILDRPSRFDRKLTFELPALAERVRYIQIQSDRLEPALRLTEAGVTLVAEQTEGYSFAYLKELFLSSMMAWIAEDGKRPMDDVVLAHVSVLSAQMKTNPVPTPPISEDDEDGD